MAGRRVIKSVPVGKHCWVRIVRVPEFDEYVVHTVATTKKLSGTYHTEDKKDARNTAAHQIRLLRRAGVCR